MTIPISPNEPKQERTGATDAQIEAAIDREMSQEGSELFADNFEEMTREIYRQVTPFLVPEGMVIARSADVLTAEQRARMKYLASFLDGYKAPEQVGCAAWDIADTIRAIAEAAPEPVCTVCGHEKCHHIGFGAFCAANHCACRGYYTVPSEQAVQEPPALDPVLVKSINELCDLVDWLAHGTVHMIGTGMCGDIFAKTAAIRAYGGDAREGGKS